MELTFNERCVLRFYQLKDEQERAEDDYLNDPLAKARVSLRENDLIGYNKTWGVTTKGKSLVLEEH